MVGRTQPGAAKPLPYALYGRVSARGRRDDERFRSPEFQMDLNRSFAKREGLPWKEYGVEVDAKGSTANRELLNRIKADIAAGKLAGVIVPKLDRLSRLPARERLELFEFIEREHGARILSATEPNDVSTPEGRFVREVFLLVARLEWERDAEGFSLAKAEAIANGIPIGALRYGYRLGPDRRPVVVPAAAELVRELYEMRAAGASLAAVLAVYEASSGKRSSLSQMKSLLSSRQYLGELSYGGELYAHRHQPIIGEELHAAVQVVNERRASVASRATSSVKMLLAGIAKCATCGAGLSRHVIGGRWIYYRCTGDHCTARVSINAAELDAHVEAAALEWLGAAADETVRAELAGEDRYAIEEALELARAATDAYLGSEATARLAPARFERGLETFQARELELEQRLEAIGEASEIAVAAMSLRRALEPGAEELEVSERRTLLAAIGTRVIVRRAERGALIARRVKVAFAAQAAAENSLELYQRPPRIVRGRAMPPPPTIACHDRRHVAGFGDYETSGPE